jgi:hypothetical protein
MACSRTASLFFTGSGKGTVAGFCEHGNEPSGSIKGREFLDQLSVLLSPSQEELSSMELVSWLDSHNGHYWKTLDTNGIKV